MTGNRLACAREKVHVSLAYVGETIGVNHGKVSNGQSPPVTTRKQYYFEKNVKKKKKTTNLVFN